MFKLEIHTDNIVFGDEPDIEVVRILRDLASKIEFYPGGFDPTGSSGILRDINGNKVGRWDLTP